ncbi:LuxR C-terminal-related transcriptional regulator [Salipiger bermudensis]|uniref:alpha/beta fold hydrolase n=1 Tax=Salipiger bermudensis TaxID=344736 RepID=UPI001C991DDC|nr:alpha/beta fold hydrolase [Salipiger bermudensis]MBY6002606.1 LuxR C-terminal-related transcriptional regulator [Salipiger bermudensis]
MAERPPDSGAPGGQNGSAEWSSLIGSLYEAAVDPTAFTRLLDLAESGLSDDTTRRSFEEIRSECERHVKKAEALLAALPGTPMAPEIRPAFTVSARGRIEDPNSVAVALFALSDGDRLAHLAPELDLELARYRAGRSAHAPVLRLLRRDTGKAALLVAERRGQDGALRFTGMDAVWHPRAGAAVQALYGLTPSEAEVLGLLASGHSPQDAAARRGRSVETIRQQVRTMLSKTDAAGLAELAHVGRAVALSSAGPPAAAADAPQRVLPLGNGRVMHVTEQGAPHGRPVIYLHGCLGGNRLPAPADAELRARGLRWIAPARPWHGESSGFEALLHDPSAYADDLATLIAELGLSDVTLVGYDAGAALALCAGAALQAGSIRDILLVSATPPMRGLRDFAAAPRQQACLALAARSSLPLLRFLSLVGDRKLRAEGRAAFAETVFGGSPADLAACRDEALLELLWTGHFFHVASGNDGFINDCRLIASDWSRHLRPLSVPLGLLHGAADAIVPLPWLRAFARECDANLQVVEGAGHALPYSHWTALLSRVCAAAD